MSLNLQSQSGQVVASTAVAAKSPGRWRHWYRVAAYAVLNSLLLLLVLNLVLYVVMLTRKPQAADSPLASYGEDNILIAYPDWQKEDVRTLLDETYKQLTVEYEPFTEFRNKPLRRKFVNVDPAGFRISKNQAPWPPRPENFNIFVFGGSTTFGMGLPDDETIASYLQECARKAMHFQGHAAVYNFGRIYYFSTQEMALFQRLLDAGFVPQVAVFIDGLNDFGYPDGQTRFASRFQRFMAGQVSSSPLDNVPMVKAARVLRSRWEKPKRAKADVSPSRALLESVPTRYLTNKKMIEAIAAAFGVRPLFVWQPVPTYQYDLSYHFLSHASFVRALGPRMDRSALMQNLFLQGRLGPNVLWLSDGYALMDNLRAQGKLGPDMLWLADMQQDKHENLYVDAVHYTAAFSKEIAERICGALSRTSQRPVRPRPGPCLTNSQLPKRFA